MAGKMVTKIDLNIGMHTYFCEQHGVGPTWLHLILGVSCQKTALRPNLWIWVGSQLATPLPMGMSLYPKTPVMFTRVLVRKTRYFWECEYLKDALP